MMSATVPVCKTTAAAENSNITKNNVYQLKKGPGPTKKSNLDVALAASPLISMCMYNCHASLLGAVQAYQVQKTGVDIMCMGAKNLNHITCQWLLERELESWHLFLDMKYNTENAVQVLRGLCSVENYHHQ